MKWNIYKNININLNLVFIAKKYSVFQFVKLVCTRNIVVLYLSMQHFLSLLSTQCLFDQQWPGGQSVLSGPGPASKLVAPLICFSWVSRCTCGLKPVSTLYCMRHSARPSVVHSGPSVGRYCPTPHQMGNRHPDWSIQTRREDKKCYFKWTLYIHEDNLGFATNVKNARRHISVLRKKQTNE